MNNASQVQNAIPVFLARITDLRTLLGDAKRIYLDQLAPDFNPFDFIYPTEMRLSEILGWLLNPSGSHAQGKAFLHLFCERYQIGWTDTDIKDAFVRTEFPLPNEGRLDILVQTKDKQKSLIIENKLSAADGTDQIKRYLSWAKTTSRPHKLIYLSADGKDPGTGSITREELFSAKAENVYLALSYTDLISWLSDCRKECRADRVSSFIRDFRRYLEKEFMGVANVTEAQEIAKLIFSNPHELVTAFRVFASQSELKMMLLEELKVQTMSLLHEKFPGIAVENKGKDYLAFYIFLNPASRLCFALESATNHKRVEYGLKRRSKEIDLSGDRSRFEKFLGEHKTSEWFAWYRAASTKDEILKLHPDWQFNSDPWVEILDKSMAKKIADAVERFHTSIKDLSLF